MLRALMAGVVACAIGAPVPLVGQAPTSPGLVLQDPWGWVVEEAPRVPPAPVTPRQSVLPPGDRLRFMQTVAAALGVDCAYCHGNRAQADRPPQVTASGKPRMDVAREMFLMVAELNRTVQGVTAKGADAVTLVQCATCHRGVPIPKQLSEILAMTASSDGPDAVAAQYHDLRARYYGRQAYDFSDEAMVATADRLAGTRPHAAIALMQANLAYYPRSSMSYMILAIAQANASDYQGAMASLRTALELDPTNNNARGRLAQLEGQVNRPGRP